MAESYAYFDSGGNLRYTSDESVTSQSVIAPAKSEDGGGNGEGFSQYHTQTFAENNPYNPLLESTSGQDNTVSTPETTDYKKEAMGDGSGSKWEDETWKDFAARDTGITEGQDLPSIQVQTRKPTEIQADIDEAKAMKDNPDITFEQKINIDNRLVGLYKEYNQATKSYKLDEATKTTNEELASTLPGKIEQEETRLGEFDAEITRLEESAAPYLETYNRLLDLSVNGGTITEEDVIEFKAAQDALIRIQNQEQTLLDRRNVLAEIHDSNIEKAMAAEDALQQDYLSDRSVGDLIWGKWEVGAAGVLSSITNVFDMAFGGFAQEIHNILNLTFGGALGDKNVFTAINDAEKAVRDRESAYYAENASKFGEAGEAYHKYGTMVTQAIPAALLAVASSGMTAGAELGVAGVAGTSNALAAYASTAEASSASQLIAATGRAVMQMAKDPNWQMSFVQEAGNAYESALAEGASESDAAIYSMLYGASSATIEVGGTSEALGGIQKLPQEVRAALESGKVGTVLSWIKSTLSEVGEEISQGIVEEGLKGYSDTKLYGTGDESAVINPDRMLEEAKGAAIVSWILGGGQIAAQKALSPKANVETETEVEPEVEAETNQNPATEEATPADPLDTLISSGESASKIASKIMSSPELASAFVNKYGVVKGNSNTEVQNNLAQKIHDILKPNPGAVNTLTETPAQVEEPAAPVPNAPKNILIRNTETGNVSEVAPPVEDKNRTQVISLIQGGMTPAQAGRLYANPELRSAFEKLTGISLEGLSVNKAKEAIINASKKLAKADTESVQGTREHFYNQIDYQDAERDATEAMRAAEAQTGAHQRSEPGGKHALPFYPKTHNKPNVSNGNIEDAAHEREIAPEYQGKHAAPEKEQPTPIITPQIEPNAPTLYPSSATQAPSVQTSTKPTTETKLGTNPNQAATVEAPKAEKPKRVSNKNAELTNLVKEALDLQKKIGELEESGKDASAEKTRLEEVLNAQGDIVNGTKETKNEPKPYVNQNETLISARNDPNSDLNQPTKPQQKDSRFTGKNIPTDSAMNPELREKYTKDKDKYDVLHNKDTLNKAIDGIAQGVPKATKDLQDAISNAQAGNKMLEPYHIPMARMLANELYSKEGKTEEQIKSDRETADQILSDISLQLTFAGQFIQAASILRNSDPRTALMSVQKAVAAINAEIEGKYGGNKRYSWRAELTQDEIDLINNTDFSEEDAYENVYRQIATRLGQEMPSTMWEKITEIRRVNMLLKPKTMVKNFCANAPTILIRKSDNLIANALGALATKLTKLSESEMPKQRDDGSWITVLDVDGKRVPISAMTEADCINAAKIAKSGQMGSIRVSERSKAIAEEVRLRRGDALKDISKKWDINGILREERTIFKKVTALEHARRLTFKALEAGDVPFVNAAFDNALAHYCELHKIESADNVPEEGIAYAVQQAEYYTYKEATIIGDTLNKLKHKGGALGRAVDVFFPFTTTPINIFRMMWDHTAGGAINILQGAKNGNVKQTIEGISKTATGSITIGLGYILASLGYITGGEDDDYDKAALDKATGKAAYSITDKNPLSKIFGIASYDWAEPAGSLLSLGADLQKFFHGDKDGIDLLLNVLYDSGDAMMNMGVMQSVSKLIKTSRGGSATQTFFENLATSFAGQMGIGLAGTIGATVDPNNRYYYDSNASLDENMKNQFLYSSGLRGGLEAKPNIKGEFKTRGNALQRFVENMVLPWNTNHGEPNAVDNMLYDLYNDNSDVSGINNIFPEQSPGRYTSFGADGESVLFTPAERSAWQTTYADEYYSRLDELMQTDAYKTMDGAQVKDAILAIKGFCKDVADTQLANGRGIEYESDSDSLLFGKTRNGADWAGVSSDNVVQYLAYKSMYSAAIKDGNMDYDAIDTVIASYENMPADVQTAFNERVGNHFSTYLKAYQDYGISSLSVTRVLDAQDLAKADGKYDKANDGNLTQFSGILNAGVTESVKAAMVDIQLGENAKGLYDAALKADPNVKVEDVYQLWRSCCVREMKDANGNTTEYRSRKGSISQYTLYTALESGRFAFADTDAEKNAIWEAFVNTAPDYTGDGEKVNFDVAKEDAYNAKVYVDGVEMTRGKDYTVYEGYYGNEIVFKTPPPDESDVKIDDGNASAKSYTKFRADRQRWGTEGYYSRFIEPPEGGWKP